MPTREEELEEENWESKVPFGIEARREEIREGMRPFFCECCEPADRGCSEYDGQCSMVSEVLPKLLSYLDSVGVVIKVEGWLPTRNGMVCTIESLIGNTCDYEYDGRITDPSEIVLKSLTE